IPTPTPESAQVRNELGEAGLNLRGELELAREHHLFAQRGALDLGEGVEAAPSLRLLRLLGKERGPLEEAKALYRQALSLLKQAGDRRLLGATLASLAAVHRQQGHMGEAERRYQEALSLVRQEGDARVEGSTLINLAVVNEDQGRPEE